MNATDFLARWREAGPAERANKDSFLAELCDVLGVERPLRAKAAFKGAKDEALAASLDSLAALGLAVASGAGPARSWSAVR